MMNGSKTMMVDCRIELLPDREGQKKPRPRLSFKLYCIPITYSVTDIVHTLEKTYPIKVTIQEDVEIRFGENGVPYIVTGYEIINEVARKKNEDIVSEKSERLITIAVSARQWVTQIEHSVTKGTASDLRKWLREIQRFPWLLSITPRRESLLYTAFTQHPIDLEKAMMLLKAGAFISSTETDKVVRSGSVRRALLGSLSGKDGLKYLLGWVSNGLPIFWDFGRGAFNELYEASGKSLHVIRQMAERGLLHDASLTGDVLDRGQGLEHNYRIIREMVDIAVYGRTRALYTFFPASVADAIAEY